MSSKTNGTITFGIWLTVAACGQLASLLLIDAGPRLHFQHYRLARNAFGPIVLSIQAIVVCLGLWRQRQLLADLLGKIGVTRLLFAAAISGATCAALSPRPAQLIMEVTTAFLIQLVQLGTLFLLVESIPAGWLYAWSKRLRFWLGAAWSGDSAIAVLACAVFLTTACLSWFLYANHPHIPDEVVYTLHARYFAAGMLTLPEPPVPRAFDIDLMMLDHGRWFSPVAPGWPAILAIGTAFGCRWLINPLLAGLNVWLSWKLISEVYPLRTSRAATILLCCSPWFLFMSMNFMTHTALMTTVTVALLGIARAARTESWLWLVGAGAAIGYACLIRPLDGLIGGVLTGMFALFFPDKRLKWSQLTVFVAAAILVAGVVLIYNAQLTGSAFQYPIMEYMDRTYHPGSNSLGFGANRGVGWALDAYPGHTPFEAVLNALLNGFSVNVELHGWGIGSLWAIALAAWSSRRYPADKACCVAIATVLGFYSLYYYHGGPEFGARYWYQMLLPLVVLSVRGIEQMESLGDSDRVLAGAILLTSLTIVIYLPWRMLDKYPHFLGMRPDVRQLAQEFKFGRSLVLIRGDRHPDYASAAIYNPLDLRPESSENVPIYAWDRDEAVHQQLLSTYADRPVWVLDGPTRTGSGFKVVQGPAAVRHDPH